MLPLIFDINGPEFLLLLALAVILFGPERLPDLARKAARVIRYVRTMASGAQEQLSRELGPGFEDLDFRDLNPRAFVQKHLLDDVEPIIADVRSEISGFDASMRDSVDDVTSAIEEARQSDPGKLVSPGGPHYLMDDATPSELATPFDVEAT